MTKHTDWREAVAKAEHYKALGIDEVYLDRESDFPWDLTTRCEPGGSYRIGISTSIWFYADHPSGITFRWCYDIESREAQGSGHYQIKSGELQEVMARIPDKARITLRNYFRECAAAVKAQGDRYVQYAKDQHEAAEVFTKLARR